MYLYLRSVQKKSMISATDPTFYELTGIINHMRCWENTRKVCKSWASDSGNGSTKKSNFAESNFVLQSRVSKLKQLKT